MTCGRRLCIWTSGGSYQTNQRPFQAVLRYQHIQLHSAKHTEVLGSAWRCLGTSKGLYREWTKIHGQTNMTIWHVGAGCVYGPLEVPSPSKHIAKHPLTLSYVYWSIWQRLEVPGDLQRSIQGMSQRPWPNAHDPYGVRFCIWASRGLQASPSTTWHFYMHGRVWVSACVWQLGCWPYTIGEGVILWMRGYIFVCDPHPPPPRNQKTPDSESARWARSIGGVRSQNGGG